MIDLRQEHAEQDIPWIIQKVPVLLCLMWSDNWFYPYIPALCHLYSWNLPLPVNQASRIRLDITYPQITQHTCVHIMWDIYLTKDAFHAMHTNYIIFLWMKRSRILKRLVVLTYVSSGLSFSLFHYMHHTYWLWGYMLQFNLSFHVEFVFLKV